MQREFRGLGASSGIALGPALVWRPVQPASAAVRAAGSPEEETVRLQAARQAAEEELAELRDRAEREMGGEEAAIFSAHLLMLSDPALMGEAEELVRQGLSAEAAVEQATERQAALLAALPDAVLGRAGRRRPRRGRATAGASSGPPPAGAPAGTARRRRRPRLDAVPDGPTAQGPAVGHRDGGGRPHVARGHHGASAGHSRGGGRPRHR